MIDLLDRALERLLHDSGAAVAVIWSSGRDSEAGVVVRSHPVGLRVPGSAWPETDHSTSGIVHRDPAVVASLVPTSLRLELPAPANAAISLNLNEPGLVLLLIWRTPPPGAQLSAADRNRIEGEITDLARAAALQVRQARESAALRAVVDDLKQGVVSVDLASREVTVNPAAAEILSLTPGKIDPAAFAAAMTELEGRVLNSGDVGPVGHRLLADHQTQVDCVWRFAEEPTHLRVTSRVLGHDSHTARIWIFEDISQLLQTLEASESSRKLLRANADSMLDPQVLLEAVRDTAGRVVDFSYRSVNSAACSYLGLDEGDLLGHSQLEASPNLEGSELQRRYIRCLEDGEPVVLSDFAFFNEILDDARRYDIRATRAGVDLLSLTWSDVTERFQSKRRIEASERNYRLIADNSSDVVAHIRNGRFAWISPSAGEVLGRSAEYWLGRELREIVPEADAAANAAMVQTVAEGGVIKGRARIVRADGVIRWIHLHARQFSDEGGNQDGFISAFRVIDDEVAAEEDAEAAHREQAVADARYRRTMENAPTGMCLVSSDGRFVDVNDAACQFFGLTREKLMGLSWQDLTPEGYQEDELKDMSDLLEGRIDSYRMVKPYVRDDGRQSWGDLSVSAVRDGNGRVVEIIGQIVDVTAEVEARDVLQRHNVAVATELRSAADYMASIMPRGLVGKLAVSSRYLPSRQLGGDCFDYTWVDDDRLLVYLLDVSGHGIEPALLSVSVHNMLRSGLLYEESADTPDAILAELNRRFQMDRHNERYFTIWLGVYEASTRTLRYCSAGAPPAFAVTGSGSPAVQVTELPVTSAPVGMFEDSVFASLTYEVPEGCQLLLFSDGAAEVELPDGGQWGISDLTALTTRLAGSCDWTLDDLIAELHTVNRESFFEDDVSLIQLTFG